MTLDPKILGGFKEKLIQEKERLENELLRFAKPTGIPGDYETRFNNIGTDTDENASEVEEYADNLALENTLEKQLREINDALGRMEKGAYGMCKNCNREINIERLKAYPAAGICIKCGK